MFEYPRCRRCLKKWEPWQLKGGLCKDCRSRWHFEERRAGRKAKRRRPADKAGRCERCNGLGLVRPMYGTPSGLGQYRLCAGCVKVHEALAEWAALQGAEPAEKLSVWDLLEREGNRPASGGARR